MLSSHTKSGVASSLKMALLSKCSEEKERWAKETHRRGTEGGDGSKSADAREDERAEERDWS